MQANEQEKEESGCNIVFNDVQFDEIRLSFHGAD